MIKSIRVAVATAAVFGMMPVVASASVLTFDDLTTGSNQEFYFTANYDGFKFGDNSQATNAWFYTNIADPRYNAQSGSTYIATDSSLYTGAKLEATMPITSTTAFVFNGAYFSGFDTVEYQLYSNGALVYMSAESAQLSPTPIYVASGYAGLVNSVVILGTQGYYAVDNFTYSVAPAVPETSVAALFLAGLLVLTSVKGRFRAHF